MQRRLAPRMKPCVVGPARMSLIVSRIAMHILLQSSLVSVLLLIGCARTHTPTRHASDATIGHESVVLTLHDGYSGRSFGGRWIRLHADGRYMEIRYTDVVTQERVKRGVYRIDKARTHLTLEPGGGGDTEHLYRVDYGQDMYWVHDAERAHVTLPGEFWLKEVPGWFKVPERFRF